MKLLLQRLLSRHQITQPFRPGKNPKPCLTFDLILNYKGRRRLMTKNSAALRGTRISYSCLLVHLADGVEEGGVLSGRCFHEVVDLI
jgi:hypothetical protein